MKRHLILVCHATDGHFADGNRQAVQQVLNRSMWIARVDRLGRGRYVIHCPDGGRLELNAPGLDGRRSFHRMEVVLDADGWTKDILNLILELMRSGGFGLMDSLDASQFIVASPDQVSYFPRLPKAPLLVRNSRDLGYSIL
jgi:hypothetical protein